MSAPAQLASAASISVEEARKLRRLRRLVKLMDQALRVPGTSISVGLDSVAGLVPIVGDMATAAAAVYIVKQAEQMGVDRAVLRRMYANVAIDCLGGFLPVVGDLFDVTWKANTKNLKLLEECLSRR